MSTIFGRWGNVPGGHGGGQIYGGDDVPDSRLGGDAHNFAVRTVATTSIAFVLSASLVAIACAQTAAALPLRLKGAYGFTGSTACLVAPGSTVPPGPNPTPGI